ncbi:MAG TPA: asparagine synthase (glutamine-hydrolyzing) [Acetobacteraceae bacterium]|nr:asparagine synthase (glutamine-hydrolyzing) [Acetobacteraceae bacterium]
MCGITGILLPPGGDPHRLAWIEPMTAALHHRGPDAEGFWADAGAGVVLGHRRLAIVDLSETGRQPMISHSGDLVVTYNGEIYNFLELREELQAIGCQFRGSSDTEVMLAAFEQFGIEAALRRFAGMFAIGLWDRRRRVLHLIRDRMGKKPIYVTMLNGVLLFASELKALQRVPGFDSQVNRYALAMVLHQGWIADNACIWDGVFKLLPGTMLSVNTADLEALNTNALKARMRTWWSLTDVATTGQGHRYAATDTELVNDLDQLLRVAVGQRMVADVPLGAFLSGGIDSSVVVAVMQAQSTRPVRTFTVGFTDEIFDEASYAARIASYLGTDHTELRLTPAETQAAIPDIPAIWDEPFADESQIPTYLISGLARQYVTVALSGDGGDENFAGYARHFMPNRFASILAMPGPVRRMAAATLSLLDDATVEEIVRRLPLPTSLRRSLTAESLRKLLLMLQATGDDDLYERLIRVTAEPASLHPFARAVRPIPNLPDRTSRLSYWDTSEYLPGDILVKLDRASMAVSLEARCPLLDHRLVEFAWRVPSSAKVKRGKGKWLLRQVLGRYIPESLFERPKQGFNVPVGTWLRGPLRDWAEDLLAPARLQSHGLLDTARVQTCWEQHLRGHRNRASELWAILMVQAWLVHSRITVTDTDNNHGTKRALVPLMEGIVA